MQKHYSLFKLNLSQIQLQFKQLLSKQSSSYHNNNKTLDAKVIFSNYIQQIKQRVSLLIQKYMQQSPTYLYEIITRNLGKSQITWDDLLKCFQDQFQLISTVLKTQSKNCSTSQAYFNQQQQSNYFSLLNKIKLKSICHISKPSLNINIAQSLSKCDILSILLEKQIIFYLVQEEKIISSLEFKYRNVKRKLINKDKIKQYQKYQKIKNNQIFDQIAPINYDQHINLYNNNYYIKDNKETNPKTNNIKMSYNNYGLRRNSLLLNSNIKTSSNYLNHSYTSKQKQQQSCTSNSKKQNRSRKDSSIQSQFQALKRRQTSQYINPNQWKRKPTLPSTSIQKKDSIKLRTNTTKKVFEYFQTATLQNSIQIATKFQQARQTFQPYIYLQKNILQKQKTYTIEDIKLQKNKMNYSLELQKMRLTSKSLGKYKMKNSRNEQYSTSINVNQYAGSKKKMFSSNMNGVNQYNSNNNNVLNTISRPKAFFNSDSNSNKPKISNKHSFLPSSQENLSLSEQPSAFPILQSQPLQILSYHIFETYLLLSFYNNQIRLYRIKRNLSRLKQQLIFEKENQFITIHVQLYKSLFTNKYNMILCEKKGNNFNIIKIYQIKDDIIMNYKLEDQQKYQKVDTALNKQKKEDDIIDNSQKSTDRYHNNTNTSKMSKYQNNMLYKQIFTCKLSFDPIYQNIIPLGIAGYNQKGMLALIQTNTLGPSQDNKCQKKLFQKPFYNLITGSLISFTCCKIHSNLLYIYLTCKNGYLYCIQRLNHKIKLQRRLSQHRLIDMCLMNSSSQILLISQKGQLFISNSMTLQQMYYMETFSQFNNQYKLLNVLENKYIFYNNKEIKVINIKENQDKIMQFQKPLKIYKNRVKIKQQQEQISKQVSKYQWKRGNNNNRNEKNRYNINNNNNNNNNPNNRKTSILTKPSQSFTSSHPLIIKTFFSITFTQIPHYLILLQSGQLLVYNYKSQYFGSYLIQKSLTLKQCQMNKKLHYLAVLYTNNVIEVVNLYNQNVMMKVGKDEENDEEEIIKGTIKKIDYENTNVNRNIGNNQIIKMAFMYAVSVDNNQNTTNNTNHNTNNNLKSITPIQSSSTQFLLTLDSQFIIFIYTSKGIKSKQIDIKSYYSQLSQISSQKQYSKITSFYLDKSGILFIGTQKGELFLHQKTTYAVIKSIKLSYYSIKQIQSLSKSCQGYQNISFSSLSSSTSTSIFSIQKDKKNQYLLISTQNNQIFLFNKLSKIYIKIYENNQQININNKKIKKYKKNIKIAAFSQFIVIYQWQQIYTKTQIIQQIIQVQSDKLQINDFNNNNKDNQYYLNNINQNNNKKKEQNQIKVKKIKKTYTYTNNGYLVENVGANVMRNNNNNSLISQNKNSNKLSIRQNMSQQNKNNKQSNNNMQQKQYFLQIWNTQFNYNNKKQSTPIISPTTPTPLTQPLPIHKHLYPFIQGTKLTIIIQPSYQDKKRNKQQSSLLSSLSLNKQQKQQKQKQKTLIKVYDFSQWLKGINYQIQPELVMEEILG